MMLRRSMFEIDNCISDNKSNQSSTLDTRKVKKKMETYASSLFLAIFVNCNDPFALNVSITGSFIGAI